MKNQNSLLSVARRSRCIALILFTPLICCQSNQNVQTHQTSNDARYHCEAFDVEDLAIWHEGDMLVKGHVIPFPVTLPDQTVIFKASRMGISISRLVVDGNQVDPDKTTVDYDAQPGYYDESRTVDGDAFVYQMFLGNLNETFDEETDYGIETETTEGEVEFFNISPSWKEIEIDYQIRLPTGIISDAYILRVER